ncbi:N-terminal like protein [Dictyocaulus viviparus]|uniref:N-terminal like protein n=1 Tax=Dictyocaulus viviparus TaxID=29172 RepID=A0A0D8XST2_DICVI|nr:N-terminal like protein [Dictyocaulus viviparus]
MSPSKISSDLDLVLDRISIEYPALVMETFLSRNISFQECGSCSTAVQLPLPPSGLPYSAKFVVVYEINSRSPPGVLVVSGEGVARHWPCLLSSIHDEVVIDLASEVTLAVHFLERTSEGTSFVLTTTSGSVYLIHGSGVSMRGKIQFSKVGSREFHGIGKRFSNIIFGSPSSAVYSTLPLLTVFCADVALRGALYGTPPYGFCFSCVFSPAVKSFLQYFVKRPSKNNTVANLNVWLLDAAIFRDGILLLLAGNHDKMSNLSIFLAYTRFNISALTDVMWFSNIPVEQDCLREFEISVQSVYLPNHFNKHTSPSLNKILSFPTGTKGFDDDLKNEKFLMDDLLDIKDSISREDKSLGVLVSAFSSFAAKNIIGADETMKPLLKRSNNDLTAVIYDFLKIIIDRPVGCNPEMELTRKKVICNRILLFLKHMGVYDKVASTKLLLYNQRHSRTGVSILSEMSERVYVAIALRDWEVVREDRAEILEQITKRLAQISNVHYGYDSMLYSTLSIIHNLPAACAETIRELLEKAVDKAAKRRLVQLCADMLLTFSNAIDSYRRDASSVVVPQCDVQWTTGVVSDAYSVVCKILLKELKSTEASQTDKIGLRDSIVRLIIFHLSECGEQIDGHELIMALYDLGERKLADFKVLVEACLQLDQTERRAKLEAYKLRYSAEEFDLYLCRYLKQKNLNELLLEEKGERVDRYLLSCEEIRWRRELQNNQFEQSLYAFAKLAAACTIVEPSDIIRECTKKLLLIKHQLLVPESLIKRVYSDNPYQPLTAAELIELNLIDEDIVEGHKRALYLLATLLQDNGSAEIRSEVAKIWISLLKCTNWNQVATVYEVADTPFGSVLRSIGDDDDSLESLQLVLPCSDTLIRDCKKELSTNEFAPKWVRAAIDRTVSTIRTKLGERENEAKKKKSVSLTVPRMPDLFGCRSLPRSDKHEYVMAQ